MNLYILGGLTGGMGQALWNVSPKALAVGRKHADLTSEESIHGWVQEIAQDSGPLHIINLTGISRSAMLHKQSAGDWHSMLDVNLVGSALLLKHLRLILKEHPGTTITLVGSVTVRTAPAGTAIYTASKSALEGLVRVVAHEFAPLARVNLIELGYCDQGMIKQVRDQESMIRSIPLGRLGTANDLNEAWKFCMNCQYLTGAIIPVNGGLA